MPYSLTSAQSTALTTERDNLQATINGYDTQSFIDALDAGVVQAQEVDDAFSNVFDNFHSDSDTGALVREQEVLELDGTIIREPINDELVANVTPDGDSLEEMGQITPVINAIVANSGTPINIISSAAIRKSINRFYPDADDKSDQITDLPDSTATDVFPGPSWFALNNGSEINVKNVTIDGTTGAFSGGDSTTYQESISPFTPALTVSDGGFNDIYIGDNERYLLYHGVTLLNLPGTNATGVRGITTALSIASIRGIQIGGTSTFTDSSTGGDSTYKATVNDRVNINSADVIFIAASTNTTSTTTTPPGGTNPVTTFNTTNVVEFIKLDNTSLPSGAGFPISAAGGINPAGLIVDINNLRRYAVDYPTQPLMTDRIAVIRTELLNIYLNRYNAANSRANWNNGSLSLLNSKINTRLNLLSPANLLAAGLITQTEFDNDEIINEYTRAADRIDYIQSVLDGAS